MEWLHEKALWQQGCRAVCGVDEVGRGPLAGPVVTAAVLVPKSPEIREELAAVVRDSKGLKAVQREEIAALIRQRCSVALGMADVAEIGALNIRGATLLAMRRAVDGLQKTMAESGLDLAQTVDGVLVDGRDKIPGLQLRQQPIVKGDFCELAVACASIVAKVHRDALMTELAQRYPGYGWERNAGYGTAMHLKGLQTLGVTPEHRTGFAPVAAVLAAAAGVNAAA